MAAPARGLTELRVIEMLHEAFTFVACFFFASTFTFSSSGQQRQQESTVFPSLQARVILVGESSSACPVLTIELNSGLIGEAPASVESVDLEFTHEGSLSFSGADWKKRLCPETARSKTWSVQIGVHSYGAGELRLTALATNKDGSTVFGRSDSLFVLNTPVGLFSNHSGFFELKREWLERLLEIGEIDREAFDQELGRLLRDERLEAEGTFSRTQPDHPDCFKDGNAGQ